MRPDITIIPGFFSQTSGTSPGLRPGWGCPLMVTLLGTGRLGAILIHLVRRTHAVTRIERVALTLVAGARTGIGAREAPARARSASPEELALEYGRAVYANDAEAVWRVFLSWVSTGVRVEFGASVDPEQPLEVAVTPPWAIVAPGERIRVTLQARNIGSREVTTRVGHRIEPRARADSLALLLCPLLVPVTLAPGESREFVSEYLLLADVPAAAKAFTVTYRFPPE